MPPRPISWKMRKSPKTPRSSSVGAATEAAEGSPFAADRPRSASTWMVGSRRRNGSACWGCSRAYASRSTGSPAWTLAAISSNTSTRTASDALAWLNWLADTLIVGPPRRSLTSSRNHLPETVLSDPLAVSRVIAQEFAQAFKGTQMASLNGPLRDLQHRRDFPRRELLQIAHHQDFAISF